MRSYTEEFSPTPPALTPISAGASFGIRFLARLIDLIFSIAVGFCAGFVSGILLLILSSMGHVPENWPDLIAESTFWSYVTAIVGGMIYHTFAEGIGATSLGKLICGLNVSQVDGQPCSLVGALKRAIGYPMDALFFGLVGYSSMQKSALQQRYGDVWAKTVVAKRSVYIAEPKVAGWRVAVGIAVGATGYLILQVTLIVAPLLSP